MSAARRQFVFGYGSLAGLHGRPARLEGYRRVWGVAMDNRVDIPGYKRYRVRADGSRPAVYVAFLDIAEQPGATTQGLLIAADDITLRALDARERNYERIDVSAAVADAPGAVWAYRGSAAGRERLRVGLERGCAVVAAQYLADARAALALHGLSDELDVGNLAVIDLERVDLPPG
jgi:hypothetical protein